MKCLFFGGVKYSTSTLFYTQILAVFMLANKDSHIRNRRNCGSEMKTLYTTFKRIQIFFFLGQKGRYCTMLC